MSFFLLLNMIQEQVSSLMDFNDFYWESVLGDSPTSICVWFVPCPSDVLYWRKLSSVFNLKHTQKTVLCSKSWQERHIILQDPGICISSRGLSDEAVLNACPPTFLSCRICTTSPMTWCVSCLPPSQILKSSTLNLTSTKKDWSASGSSMKSLLILMR